VRLTPIKRPAQKDKSAGFGVLWTKLFPWLEQPVAQHAFCPTRKWRCDWAFLKARIIVEIEGGLWTGGGHARGSGVVRDMERGNAMVLHGWRCLRFSTNDLKRKPIQIADEVANLLLENKEPSP
jgi:very-short-patch-repair endonuclease